MRPPAAAVAAPLVVAHDEVVSSEIVQTRLRSPPLLEILRGFSISPAIVLAGFVSELGKDCIVLSKVLPIILYNTPARICRSVSFTVSVGVASIALPSVPSARRHAAHSFQGKHKI